MMNYLALLLGATLLMPQAAAPAPVPVPVRDDKSDAAIKRAIDFLISQQDRDGGIQTRFNWANRTAMTALSIMAMASVGHQPADDTAQGHAMKNALAYVLKPEHQDVDGYFGLADGSRMYGHGIITLTLAELLGMGADTSQDKLITERCKAAVQLIPGVSVTPGLWEIYQFRALLGGTYEFDLSSGPKLPKSSDELRRPGKPTQKKPPSRKR